MSWCWTRRFALGSLALAAAPRPLHAQQRRYEAGGEAMVLASSPAVVLGGGYGAIRLSPRTRMALTASAGATDGAFAWRAELLGHFLLNPRSTTRSGWYGGGGAAVMGSGGHAQGYVVLLVGVEARPGGSSGWALEAGFGGGFRATAGWRWRLLH